MSCITLPNLLNIRAEICSVLSSTDKYIIQHLIDQNIQKMVKLTIKTHEKKLKNLTKTSVLLFTSTDTVLNLPSVKLTEEELSSIKYGLKDPIESMFISTTDVLTIFHFVHRAMKKDLKDNRDAGGVKAKLSYLVNSYTNSYKPTKKVLRKYRVLNKLRSNEDISLTKPDKGNGVVIINRWLYMSRMYDNVNDASKFLKLSSDPTSHREGTLPRFLHTLKNKDFFTH